MVTLKNSVEPFRDVDLDEANVLSVGNRTIDMLIFCQTAFAFGGCRTLTPWYRISFTMRRSKAGGAHCGTEAGLTVRPARSIIS